MTQRLYGVALNGTPNVCDVCGSPSARCVPSPFRPLSYDRCQECVKAKRVAYDDLLLAVHGRPGGTIYDADLGREYVDRYIAPTLEQFGKTEEQMLADSAALVKKLNEESFKAGSQ